MSDNQSKIKRLMCEMLGVQESELQPEARLIEDLGADSLDLVELVMAIEEDFEFEISDEEAEKLITVQNVLDHVNARVPA